MNESNMDGLWVRQQEERERWMRREQLLSISRSFNHFLHEFSTHSVGSVMCISLCYFKPRTDQEKRESPFSLFLFSILVLPPVQTSLFSYLNMALMFKVYTERGSRAKESTPDTGRQPEEMRRRKRKLLRDASKNS